MAYLEDRIPEFSIAVITGAVAFLIGVVALSLRTHLTATNVSLVWAVTSVLPLVIVFRPVRAARMWETRSVASALVRFSLKANVATLALILAWRVDIFLVKGFRGLSELGLYAVAVGLAEIMLQIAVSFRIALTPLQGSADRRDTLVSSICRVSRITLAAGALTALVVALTATPIVRGLYGNRYADAGAALAWLMPGIVALVLQGPFIDYLLIEGQLKAVTVATVVALLINVGMNVALLQHHTFVAASVASTVSYFVSCVWCMWLFARTTGCSLADMVLIRRADVTAVLRRRARTTS
jgi:O-antigen/teichoic acid export membrane protein